MLVEIKRLNIINEGFKRKISLDKIFINSQHIISIRDYHGAKEFLLSEGSGEYAKNNFSLLKINNGKGVEEVIALGSSEELYVSFKQPTQKGKRLLNEDK